MEALPSYEMTEWLSLALLFAMPLSRAGDVTFSRDVAPILYKHCASCHRPGQVAPFSLLSYSDAAKRAKLIATVTSSRYMPPWEPEPGYGHFQGERRLADADMATLRQWAAEGAPEGDRAELAPAPNFPEGWQLGSPDLTLRKCPSRSP